MRNSIVSWQSTSVPVGGNHAASTPPVSPPPVIGILADTAMIGGTQAAPVYVTGGSRGDYARAVQDNGGTVRWIENDGRRPEEQLRGLHGLVIPGGGDINPELYGQRLDGSFGMKSMDFDVWEMKLTREAVRMHLPVRGICRGHQMLNVAFGGNLMQDIRETLGRPYTYTMPHRNSEHYIVTLPGSRLCRVLESEAFEVPSNHHQALDAVAAVFIPVARTADGIIEAIEMTGNPRVMGVQFHPERALYAVRDPFFSDLVKQARDYRHEIGGDVAQVVVQARTPPPAPPPAAPASPPAPPPAAPAPPPAAPPAAKPAATEESSRTKFFDALRDGFAALAQHDRRLDSDLGELNDKHASSWARQPDNLTLADKNGKKLQRLTKIDATDLLLSLTPDGRKLLPEEVRRQFDLVEQMSRSEVQFLQRSRIPLVGSGKRVHLLMEAVWLLGDKKLEVSYPELHGKKAGQRQTRKIDTEQELRQMMGIDVRYPQKA